MTDGGSGPWWLPRTVPVGQTLVCRLGTLLLDLHHRAGEWQLVTEQLEERAADARPQFALQTCVPEAGAGERFIVDVGERVELVPLLADRPVVIRPRTPLFLLPGAETTMYLSTPLYLRIQVGEKAPVVLRELPMLRLSDTWFGPSTREGELCYAGKTHARHTLDELPRRVHRAITAVRIANHAPSTLPLERLSLPVPLLSVFGGVDGRLWTQGVSLQRGSDSDLAALKIDEKPPGDAGSVTRLAGPRQLPARGGVVRAFSLLFRE
ncbi:MAG: hypothetical protein JJT93_02235 [Gammaproteobacteria bacterium]|nr:hypothetical protein [Gammaproteobacteria bacterium]TVQ48342.1 MAG: hypothetical protein EA371_06395 [Gammaproteobacteria bacterium]